MKKQLLTLNEVADYLKLSTSSVYKLAREGRIPAFKVLNKWRFDSDLIDKLIKNKCVNENQST
jgi:excisionase family DNA binding protein